MIISIGLLLVVACVVGYSYALWFINKSQESKNLVSSSCLEVNLVNESSAINVENGFPITDEQGRKEVPYSFKLENTCNIKAKVSIILDIDKTENLNLNMFKVMLNNSYYEWEPTLISKKDTELNPDTTKFHKIIATDILEPLKEESYELRLWLDESVTQSDVIASLLSQIRIELEPYRACNLNITDPNPGEFRGSGTEADPYLIESGEDLISLSYKTNAGLLPHNAYYELTTDLNLSCESSYVDYSNNTFGDINNNGIIEDLVTEVTTYAGFDPIGNEPKCFSSNFNGNNHTIDGLYVNRTKYAGLFGYIDVQSGLNLKISNLNIGITNLIASYSGGLVAYLYSYSGEMAISNILTYGNIENNNASYVGGIIGKESYNASIYNCINKVNIIGGNYIGGTIGDGDTIKNAYNLKNYGNLNSVSGGYAIAGIAGHLYNYNTLQKFDTFYNYGEIKTEKPVRYIGGCFGYNDINKTMTYVYNYGNINVVGYEGGYVGGVAAEQNNAGAIDCYNYGDIYYDSKGSRGYALGGVIGYIDQCYEVLNIANYAEIMTFDNLGGNSYVGGVFGYYSPYSGKTGAIINTSNIIVNNNNGGYTIGVGGLFGYYSGSSIISGYNTGNINVSSSAIVGISFFSGGYGATIADGFYVLGNMDIKAPYTNTSYIGILSYDSLSSNISDVNFYYKGKIISTAPVVGLTRNTKTSMNNIYLDIETDASTEIINSVAEILDKTISNVFYKITGNSNYKVTEGSSEYDFSNVTSAWFRDTLHYDNRFQIEEGYYPLLNRLDINGNPIDELVPDQKKIPIE